MLAVLVEVVGSWVAELEPASIELIWWNPLRPSIVYGWKVKSGKADE